MPHWRQRKFYLHMRHVRNEKREWNSQCEEKNTNVGVRMEGVNLNFTQMHRTLDL